MKDYMRTIKVEGITYPLVRQEAIINAKNIALDIILAEINSLFPAEATASNQLADKEFVTDAISTNTALFKGTYTTLADIEAIVDADDNDYAYLSGIDAAGNTIYKRYKYSDGSWLYEWELSNTQFTTDEWAAIRSGVTSALVTKLNNLYTKTELDTKFNNVYTKSEVYTKNEVDTALSAKQTTLVSGTNIKTINNTTVLGSGNFNLVESSEIKRIVTISQSEYDSLVSKDVNTEYNVIED